MRILSLIAWVCLGGVLSLGAQTFDRYGNRTDRYDSSDPFNRDQVYPGGMDSLNIFGERILSPREQARQDCAAQRSTRDRQIYTNRYKDSIQVYKIIDLYGDTTLVDTTLNIGKYYKLNPTRRDEYGYMPFPNLAEGYTPLVYTEKPSLTPAYGIRSRSMYYRTTDQVKYYDVRTPWSEVMYHSNVFSNMTGQVLDFNFTVNAGKQVNFSFGFRGKRTFGLYNYIESHHGQLVGTFSYHTKSYRYIVRSHVMYQYLSAVENGGLTEEGIGFFLSDDEQFSYRKTIPVNLGDSDGEVANRLGGTRFFVTQSYDIFNSSIKNPKGFRVSLLNEIKYEHLTYKYYDPAFVSPSGSAGQKSLAYYGSGLLEGAARTDSSYYNTLDLAAGAGVNFPLVNIYAQGMIRYQTANYSFPGPKRSGVGDVGQYTDGQSAGALAADEVFRGRCVVGLQPFGDVLRGADPSGVGIRPAQCAKPPRRFVCQCVVLSGDDYPVLPQLVRRLQLVQRLQTHRIQRDRHYLAQRQGVRCAGELYRCGQLRVLRLPAHSPAVRRESECALRYPFARSAFGMVRVGQYPYLPARKFGCGGVAPARGDRPFESVRLFSAFPKSHHADAGRYAAVFFRFRCADVQSAALRLQPSAALQPASDRRLSLYRPLAFGQGSPYPYLPQG